jgi:hypothetical protein
MDTTNFTITEKNGKWQILNAYKIPMGGYSFPSQERANEVLDCLARGGTMVDGYLIQPDEVQANSSAISSGLGISGINNDQSMPSIPSVRAIERVQKMHDTDTICKKCGASENFDGAMFTTLGDSGICDDCA